MTSGAQKCLIQVTVLVFRVWCKGVQLNGNEEKCTCVCKREEHKPTLINGRGGKGMVTLIFFQLFCCEKYFNIKVGEKTGIPVH